MDQFKNLSLVCDICGKEGAKVRHVSRSYGKGDNLLVIENVPVISCPHCGESYLTAVRRLSCKIVSNTISI